MLYNLSMPLTDSELQEIDNLENNDLLRGLEPGELASIARTTRYTISRMLSEWEAQGVLEAGRDCRTLNG